MSLINNTAGATAGLPAINFHLHHGGHKKGSSAESATSTPTNGTATTPAPATTQNLLNSLLDSLEQEVSVPAVAGTAPAAASTPVAAGKTSAASSGAASTAVAAGKTSSIAVNGGKSSAAANNAAQAVQSFRQALLQALKADGLGGTAGSTTGSAAST